VDPVVALYIGSDRGLDPAPETLDMLG
jgi:hypothetical protein